MTEGYEPLTPEPDEEPLCPNCGHGPMGFVAIESTPDVGMRAEHCRYCGFIQERTYDLASVGARSLGAGVDMGTVRPITKLDMHATPAENLAGKPGDIPAENSGNPENPWENTPENSPE